MVNVSRHALITLVVVSLFCLFPRLVSGEVGVLSEEALFDQANKAYVGNDFATAAEKYKQLLGMGHESGEVLYNLGNCHFRMGELGKALVCYERAKRFMPRNRNLLDNIGLAESRAADRIVAPKFLSVLQKLLFWHYRLSARETSIVILAVNAAFWASLCVFALAKKRFVKAAVVVLGLMLVLLGGSYAFRELRRLGMGSAVVTAPEAEVRTGPGDYAVTFSLHDGARLKLVEAREGWYEIRLADGKRGWIERSKVERI
jgi:tetratricopeptide (TPR) repeat protein